MKMQLSRDEEIMCMLAAVKLCVDNNKSMDALSVPKSDIVGKIFLKIPAVGSLFNPVGIFFVMIFIGGLYVLVLGLNGLRKK